MTQMPLSSYHTIANYHATVTKLRTFFLERGFLEVDTQSRRSILAACEDPSTIATYFFAGTKWPLPQTGQMWLEYDLLKNPELPGVFCLTTSYRDEPNPIPERHLKIFPMFEFETHGNMTSLHTILEELCVWMGFGSQDSFMQGDYKNVASYFGTEEIKANHEMNIWQNFSHVFFLKNFPTYTHPFFNMKKEGDHAKKIDAILYGMETVGSAERSCNIEEMREMFHTISNGMYAKLLFNHFGTERVLRELDEFLSLDFFPRFGGGIGITRMMRAVHLAAHPEHAPFPSASKTFPTSQVSL